MNINEWNGWIPSFAKPVAGLLLSLVVLHPVQEGKTLNRMWMASGKASSVARKYCVDCHGPDKQKGDMRLDEIDPDVVGDEL